MASAGAIADGLVAARVVFFFAVMVPRAVCD
jgi:hypothetical protein